MLSFLPVTISDLTQMRHLIEHLVSPASVMTVLNGAAFGGVAALVSLAFAARKETLIEFKVPHDYLKLDSTFMDSIVTLKAYAEFDMPSFVTMIRLSDTLAYYYVKVSNPDTVNITYQHYSLAAKRELQNAVTELVSKVCAALPEETQVATENRDAFLTMVDSYVDNIQTECIEKARFIGA
jgi:hypothetical protein